MIKVISKPYFFKYDKCIKTRNDDDEMMQI
jgi:hypothetical protein